MFKSDSSQLCLVANALAGIIKPPDLSIQPQALMFEMNSVYVVCTYLTMCLVKTDRGWGLNYAFHSTFQTRQVMKHHKLKLRR